MSTTSPYDGVCPVCKLFPCRCVTSPPPAAPFIDPFVLIRIAVALERIAVALDRDGAR